MTKSRLFGVGAFVAAFAITASAVSFVGRRPSAALGRPESAAEIEPVGAPIAPTSAKQAAVDRLTHSEAFATLADRHEAAVALVASDPTERLVRALNAMIADHTESETWRAYCVQYLGECYLRSRDDGIKRAMTRLTADSSAEIAEEAVSMLARWTRRGVLDEFSLATVIRSRLDASIPVLVRVAAVRAVPAITSPSLRPDVVSLTAPTEPAAVRVAATQTLGDIGGDASASTLRTLSEGDVSVNVRTAAVGALARRAHALASP